MNPETVCPSSSLWRKLLLEEVAPLERAAMESHLEGCDPCVKVMTDLIGETSPGLIPVEPASLAMGVAMLAMLARVAATPPVVVDPPSGSTELIMPPEVPGLVDWEVVGRGGMGVVFRARDAELDRPVAVKVISSAGRLAPSARARAIREALLMASLRHPNVVPVYRSGEAGGMPFLVMEWVEGGTLQQRIASGPFSPREAAKTARDLARAVAEAHALGIIHRDLKPSNVLLAPSPGSASGFVAKLTDFGLARRGEDEMVTATGVVLGTPGYMAAEQTGIERNLAEVGPVTDVHGLGAILYACLTGRAPYAGQSTWESLVRAARGASVPVKELRGDVPRDLATIVEKCLQPSPSSRYRSAGELADDLDRFLEGRPVSARPASVPDRAIKWSRRHPALAASAALLVVAAIAAVAGTAYHVASISRALRDLAEEQGRTRDALVAATSARNRAQLALATLTDDFVRRMVKQGAALNEDDRGFLKKVRGYFLEWPLEPDAESGLKFRARGFARLGDIFEAIEQFDEARACRESALDAFEEARRRGFGGPEFVDGQLYVLAGLHTILGRTGKHAEAVSVIRKLLAAREPLARLTKEQSVQLVWGHVMLGTDLALLGRGAEADASFRTAIEKVEALRLAQPGDADLRELELMSHYNRAEIALKGGEMARAEAGFRKLLVLADSSLAAFPGRDQLIQMRVIASDELVQLLLKDRPDEASSVHRRRMDDTRASLDRSPLEGRTRGQFIRGAGVTYLIYERLGRPGEAEPDLARAVEDAAKLVEAEPAAFDPARNLAAVLGCYAGVFEQTGRLRQAAGMHDRVATSLAPWTKLPGRTSEVVPVVIDARRRSAEILAKLGDHAEAARRLAPILDLCEPNDRARTHLEVARQLLAAGDRDGARSAAEQAAIDPQVAPEARAFLDALASGATKG